MAGSVAVRVLVTANDAPGHLYPLVPTLLELAAAGHDVLLCCPGSAPEVIPDLASARFELRGIAVPDFPAAASREERFLFAVSERWPSLARGWVDALLVESRAWRPDVVVVEPTEHAGRVVAAVLQTPWVEHGWGFTLPDRIDEAANEALSDVYGAFGVAPRAPELRVDLGPLSLQAADAPEVVRFRYQPWAPAVSPLAAPGGKPRVLITLGTLPVTDAADLLGRSARAAAAAGAEPVITLGRRDLDVEGWPEKAIVVDWINTPYELSRSAAVVHHGGAGTTYAAIVAGVPAVCVPQRGDQFRNATLLSQAGACLLDDSQTPTEARVSDLVAEALKGEAVRAAVHHLREENADLHDTRALTQTLLSATAS